MSTCQNALQLHNTSIQLRAEVVHLCSASRHVARVANLPAEISNFSLCRTWLLVWCLECAEVNTSPQCLKIYIGYQLSASSLQDGLDGLEVCSWRRSNLSLWPLRTRYCHLRSSASVIRSDWHSTGSTRPYCNWTTKFHSQRTSHMEPSATSTTVTGPVGEHLQAGTKDEPVVLFSTARRHWDIFMILAPDINIQTYLLTCNKKVVLLRLS